MGDLAQQVAFAGLSDQAGGGLARDAEFARRTGYGERGTAAGKQRQTLKVRGLARALAGGLELREPDAQPLVEADCDLCAGGEGLEPGAAAALVSLAVSEIASRSSSMAPLTRLSQGVWHCCRPIAAMPPADSREFDRQWRSASMAPMTRLPNPSGAVRAKAAARSAPAIRRGRRARGAVRCSQAARRSSWIGIG